MKKILPLFLILLVLAAGCSTNPPDTANTTQPAELTDPDSDSNIQEADTLPAPTAALNLTEGPDCYGEETHPIGQSIADLFPELTDYTQVMTWFCNGFEFEDIVTALETQLVSGNDASALLAMFQNGKDWDAIWVELGIVEN